MICIRKKLLAAGCAFFAVLLAWAGPVRADPGVGDEYLPEDVRISGREMHSFSVDGRPVSVVLGDFSMTVAQRRISGRDAVIWITQQDLPGRTLREIVVYVEGKAQVIEPAGTITRDKAILVTVRHSGSLWAGVGARFERSQEDLPVYKRGLAMRESVAKAPEQVDEPVQVVVAPGAPGVAAATAPGGAEPTGPGEAVPAPPAGP
ncbi:MAG: hypothetical protein HQ546_08120, partial [Planctomycetes bacterium]|nr:hypothetical protein [Planctomycetota bacterium]